MYLFNKMQEFEKKTRETWRIHYDNYISMEEFK